MKKAYLALILGAVFIPLSAYSACVTPPDCEELGFTVDVSECKDSFLRCPWDLNMAACEPKFPLPILYGDGSVSNKKKFLNDKTPIGIVFDIENRLAVALTQVRKDGSAGNQFMQWANNNYDILSLENCEMEDDDTTILTCGVDGRENTDKILACGSKCGETPAATACNLYEPEGCEKEFCKKSKWFLPSMRELVNVDKQKILINSILDSLEMNTSSIGTQLWSSTECDTDHVWYILTVYGNRGRPSKLNLNYTRPIVQYPEVKY